MALVSRPNGTSYFTTLPAVDPAVGAKIDQELNNLVTNLNAIDNANILTSPKIAGAKVDLTTSGYLPLAGGDMTGTINHIFDGVFRLMRASGNGRIREYRGSDGAIWGIVYNTSYNEGGASWNGRDVTDICLLLRLKSTGLSLDYAASAGVGVAPTWTTIFTVDASGFIQTPSVWESSISWINAGGISQITLNNEIQSTTNNAAFVTVDSCMVYVPPTSNQLEYYALLRTDAIGAGEAAQFRLNNGATNGSTITTASATGTYAWSSAAGTIDISALSGWQAMNLQLKVNGGPGTTTAFVSKVNCRIK